MKINISVTFSNAVVTYRKTAEFPYHAAITGVTDGGEIVSIWEDSFASLKAASLELYNQIGALP